MPNATAVAGPAQALAAMRTAAWDPRLAAVVEHIEARLDSPLELPRLAALAGVSASQLERDFSQVFRITLTQFHHKTRVDHALRLLRTSMPIAEVAQACGYADPSAFARRFKEETGTTPYSWILGERVRAAEELLEQTDHSIDWIAGEVGFGNAATLRHHFGRSRGVSPQEYRRTFRMPA